MLHVPTNSGSASNPLNPLRGKSVVSRFHAEFAKQLEFKAEALLQRHPHFRGRKGFIRCLVDGQRLRLEGCVPTYYLKQLAQEAMKKLGSHLLIENRIVVASPTGEVRERTEVGSRIRIDPAHQKPR